MNNIKPKEAAAIIDSLTAGVVPSVGVQHIVVGRQLETEAIVENLTAVQNGQNRMKFWIGDFGSGKSFMFHLMRVLALKQHFVVASADFTPDVRIYSNDGKAVALYRQLMGNIAIQTKPEGGALSILIEKWISQVMTDVMSRNNLTLEQMQDEGNQKLVEKAISAIINTLTDTGGFEIGTVILQYYKGYITSNDPLRKNALKWLQGEYTTKTEARMDLGVREIVNDQNFFDVLKCLGNLFISIGYSGFMLNLDEAINLYKISNSTIREKNYEKILSIYNDCYQGRSRNLFINIAGTKNFLTNERRGLYSYDALRTRLQPNQYAIGAVHDFSQPVIMIEPINHADILVLLKNLKEIFNVRHNCNVTLTQEQVIAFMEEIYNKPGASEFLSPRDVIRDFMNVMNILRQNPSIKFESLIKDIEIKDCRPLDSLNDITEL